MKIKNIMIILMSIGMIGFIMIIPGLYFGTIHNTVKANLFIGYGLSVYGICCGIALLWDTKNAPMYVDYRLNISVIWHKTEITLGILCLLYTVFFL